MGIQMKNTLLTGSCNVITDNQTNGIELRQGGYLDFSGNPGARSNVVKNNDVSLRLAVARDLFLAGGYNNLVPVQSGAQNAVRGSIKKPCPPATIVADNNQWNASNTGISTSDYNLTTVAGSYQCNSAMPVTITDIAPASKQCSNMQLLVGSMNNPIYNCNNCETIYTSSFMGEKLNEAGLIALQQTTETGGLSDAQAVNLFNEMLMYNLPAPDDKEKYVLNFSYAQMGTALGAAFKNNELSESDNSPALSSDVQKMIDVLNKQLAEAISNDDVWDRFYYSLDKVNVYRLAGRRDLAFPVLDDMYNLSVPSDELDYLNYKNCITHLEQDLIDELITTDEYMDASLNCEQQSSGLRVYTPQSASVNNEKLWDKNSNGDMAKNITLSPNPATDKINIYNATDKILILVLKDPVGRVVYQSEISASANLDCSEFARGFYTIQLFDKQSNMVYKEKVVLK